MAKESEYLAREVNLYSLGIRTVIVSSIIVNSLHCTADCIVDSAFKIYSNISTVSNIS